MALWILREIKKGFFDAIIFGIDWEIYQKKYMFSYFKNLYQYKYKSICPPFNLQDTYMLKLFKTYYIAKFNTKIIVLMTQLPQFWIKNKIFIKIIPLNATAQFNYILKLWTTTNFDLPQRLNTQFTLYYNFMFLYFALIYKNINLLNSTLAKIITTAPYKAHRWLITNIFNFLKFCTTYLINHSNIIGLKIIFKGKLDRTGSVRKKKISLRVGRCSLNKCNIILLNQYNRIFTITGASGITSYICYLKINIYKNYLITI